MPEPTVTITGARVEHAAVVAAMLFDFNREFGVATPDTAQFARRFAVLLERDDVLVLLSGSPAQPTGFALLTLRPCPYYDGPLAQLEELYVRPGLRGGGIGTALLLTAVEQVRERAGGEIHINVDEVDVDARRFYERHGFSNVEPGQELRMLCYVREISTPA